jgi:perosamine synthetase
MDQNFIPFHRPSVGPEEIRSVREVLESRWLTTGPVTQRFELEFARYLGVNFAVALNSGTAALQLAFDAIGLRAGDEVLVPTFTFTATAEVVTYFHAAPVLCDSVCGGFNLDPSDAERRITSRTKAIIPVHIAGQPCDMDAIHALAVRHGLHVVEDAAHALPASYKGKRIGTISRLTAFSFYATKTITTAEGGMLVTDDCGYAERARLMRLHGISGEAWKRYSREGSWYYEVQEAGYKLNLPDVLGAIGSAQLAKCDQFLQRRSQIAGFYREQFADVDELENPPETAAEDAHSWHLYILRLRPDKTGVSRNTFIERMKELGIGTAVHFIPLHRHPYYARAYKYKIGDFPHAEDAFSRCVSLPLYPDLTDAEAERVADSVVQIVHRVRTQAAA